MPGSAQTKFTARNRAGDVKSKVLTKGLHTGVVIGSVVPNQLITVKPDGHFRPVICLWAASIISGLIGFKTSYIPPSKTKVLFFHTGEQYSYILASFSSILPIPGLQRGVGDHNGQALGKSKTHTSQQTPYSRVANSQGAPIDLAEGELNIENLMGVGLNLLRHMASIQGGDLAKVECLLLDDMVRIISRTFKHHSAFGDFKVSNDGGKLNVEWNGTSLDYEAWGNRKPGDAKAKLNSFGNQVEMPEGFNEDGRWRFSQYVGWLGDFINIFVTDPVNAIGRLAEDQLRAGKARVHINNDGAILLQSVADIVLEKVVCIPVPIRIRREDDPVGDRSDSGVGHSDQLAQWKPSSDGNIFEMAFQIREYARWLNNAHSLARFRQLSRDFKVPTEAETAKQAPQLNSDEEDKLKINGSLTNWRLAYSCIRIYRDGSIQTVDAYGNSMLTTKTGIQISSTQNILLQAAGSVNIVAGRDINLLARQNVGITAVKDTIRLKAKTGLWVLIESGKCIIEFIKTGVTFLKNSKFNVNNVLTTNEIGRTEVMDMVTARQIRAEHTLPDDGHAGHIFPFTPAAVTDSDEFKFQTDYNGEQLYQTFAQSALAAGEQASGAEWPFSENKVSDTKGAPWPGSNAKEKVATGGTSLNVPATTVSDAKPKALKSVDIKLKVQS